MSTTLQHPRRGLEQPLLGLAGLGFVALAIVGLGLLPDKPTALTTTITVITFGLPVLVVATLWWNGWPFDRMSRGAGGWARFAFLVVATLVLTAIGQTLNGRFDLGGITGAEGAFPIFPYAFVLAATVFVVMLQLTFVTGKMPFHNLAPVASGVAAFVTSWVVALVLFFLLLNWDAVPGGPPPPPVSGHGPVHALAWPALLLCIVVLQMLFFISLKGWPFSGIRNDALRFVVVNLFTIGGGVLLWWLAVRLPFLDGDAPISAAAAALTAAVVIREILFDGWPFQAETPRNRVLRVLTVFALTVVIYAVLYAVGSAGYPSGPGVPPVELWVAGVSLNLISAFAIVHVAVFARWPLAVAGAPATVDEDEDEPAVAGA